MDFKCFRVPGWFNPSSVIMNFVISLILMSRVYRGVLQTKTRWFAPPLWQMIRNRYTYAILCIDYFGYIQYNIRNCENITYKINQLSTDIVIPVSSLCFVLFLWLNKSLIKTNLIIPLIHVFVSLPNTNPSSQAHPYFSFFFSQIWLQPPLLGLSHGCTKYC